jgi:hypothetical protein
VCARYNAQAAECDNIVATHFRVGADFAESVIILENFLRHMISTLKCTLLRASCTHLQCPSKGRRAGWRSALFAHRLGLHRLIHPARVSRQGRAAHARLMHGGYGNVHDVEICNNMMQHMMQHSRVATQYNTMQHSWARVVATQYNTMQHSWARVVATQYNRCNTAGRESLQHSTTHQHAAQHNTFNFRQLPCRADTAQSGGPADSRQKLQLLLLAQPGMQAREARACLSARFVPARRFVRYDTASSPAMHSAALALQGAVRW